jgi:N-dimethylarginine dimethylaminohydrolase
MRRITRTNERRRWFRLRRARLRFSTLMVVPLVVIALPWAVPSRAGTPGVNEPGAVIPDTGGPIAEIALHFLSQSAEDLAPTYRDLFSALPADVSLEIVCPSAADVTSFQACWGAQAAAGGRRVRTVNVDRPITIWARDRRIARQSRHSDRPVSVFVPAWVPEYGADKRNEILVARLLADKGQIPAIFESDLHLEGGNIVSNRRHALIGANVFDENSAAFPNPIALHRELLAVLGRKYLVLRDEAGNVPFCHVDMYATPVDEETVLLASPELTMECLSACAVGSEDDELTDPLDDLAELLSTGSSTLSEIAEELRECGYQVHRLPAIIHPREDWMITYNNVLMERRAGRRIVYMPTYRLPVLDEEAGAIYQSLGFEVRTIDVSRIYQDGGAIRCLANVTARRSSDMVPAQSATHLARAAQAGDQRKARSAVGTGTMMRPDESPGRPTLIGSPTQPCQEAGATSRAESRETRS